jgi:hypothetical protein
VLVDGTSGVAKTGALTLTTPQDIGTVSTPQFLRMGLGLAADGDSVLRVYYDYSLATSISDSSGIYVATGGPRSNSGANGYGIRCIPFVGVTAYATHPLLASVYIAGIVPDSAFATITEAASVYILNAPTCGATNWALKIANGNAYFGGDIDASSTSAIYLGDSTTNGTWKIVRSGNDLIFQRRESGSYVTKGTFSA